MTSDEVIYYKYVYSQQYILDINGSKLATHDPMFLNSPPLTLVTV